MSRRLSDSLVVCLVEFYEENVDHSRWSTYSSLCLSLIDTYQIRKAISCVLFFSLDI